MWETFSVIPQKKNKRWIFFYFHSFQFGSQTRRFIQKKWSAKRIKNKKLNDGGLSPYGLLVIVKHSYCGIHIYFPERTCNLHSYILYPITTIIFLVVKRKLLLFCKTNFMIIVMMTDLRTTSKIFRRSLFYAAWRWKWWLWRTLFELCLQVRNEEIFS